VVRKAIDASGRKSEPTLIIQSSLLTDAVPLLHTVIETHKDQIAALNLTVRPRPTGARPGVD
jgi:hypothetical protein